jgi:hypothetical protein
MYQLLKLRNLAPALLILVCSYLFISLSVQASTLSGPAAGVLHEDTIPTLPPSIELSIGNSNGNAELSWNDLTGPAEHQVHRGTTPFFSADANTLLATIPLTMNSYVDTNSGIGDLNTNHFYLVIGPQRNSNHVGEIDYPLNSTNGAYSMIGIPFAEASPGSASALATQIGNVSNVYQWNANINAFKVFSPPDINDFSFVQGDAIFVQVGSGAPASANIAGRVDVKTLTLYANNYSFIAMPLQCDELTNASTTAADISASAVTNLLQWSRNLQFFNAFTPPDIGTDFTLKIGDPFIVQLSAADPSWPGARNVCK